MENRHRAVEDAGIAPDAGILSSRAGVLAMTDAAETAVLSPADPGGIPHDLRAVLAARIARSSGEARTADRYGAGDIGDHSRSADPTSDLGDTSPRISAILTFMDAVALRPRDVTAADVTSLRQAGVTDGDIVRLAELNAFLAYRLRVTAGLRLLAETG